MDENGRYYSIFSYGPFGRRPGTKLKTNHSHDILSGNLQNPQPLIDRLFPTFIAPIRNIIVSPSTVTLGRTDGSRDELYLADLELSTACVV